MLEIKLLKTVHARKKQATKLVSHIQKADIYSPEEAGSDAESAEAMEENWRDVVLPSGWTSKKFETATRQATQHMPPNEAEYVIAERSYLFAYKVPLLYLERFSKTQALDLFHLKRQAEQKFVAAISLLASRNVDGFLEAYWDCLQDESRLIERRDIEIARNLDGADGHIAKGFSSLSGKNRIALAAPVGGLHHPERYTTKYSIDDIAIVDLGGMPTSIPDNLDFELDKKRPFNEMKSAMLAYGALELSLRGSFSMRAPDIDAMGYSDLVRRLEK